MDASIPGATIGTRACARTQLAPFVSWGLSLPVHTRKAQAPMDAWTCAAMYGNGAWTGLTRNITTPRRRAIRLARNMATVALCEAARGASQMRSGFRAPTGTAAHQRTAAPTSAFAARSRPDRASVLYLTHAANDSIFKGIACQSPMKTIAALIILICVTTPTIAVAGQPSIWFCPLSQLTGPMLYTGSPEYVSLFADDAPWKNATRHVTVFKIYRDWLADATDAELKNQFAFLKRHHIALALEYGVLTSPHGGWPGEGFRGETLPAMVRRIQREGGELKYLGMDEPLSHSVFKGNGAPPLARTVADAVTNIKAVLREFPNIEFGDVEPLMDVSGQGMTQRDEIAGYHAGIEEFKAALGKPLAFFDADVDWNSRTTTDDLVALRQMLKTEQVPFGIIYDGDNQNLSDSSWLTTARYHIALAEAAVGAPDIVLFQSWCPYPKKLLPETDMDAFTSLINFYFGERTILTASTADGAVCGELKSACGKRLANERVAVSIHYRSATGAPGTTMVRGQIAPKAAFAMFEIVNYQSVPRSTHLRVTNLRFAPDGGDAVTRHFSSTDSLAEWSGSGMDRVTFDNGDMLINVDPSVRLAIDSAPFAIVTGGQYTLQVDATVPFPCEASGSFAVRFLDANKKLISQYPFLEPVIPFLAPLIPAGTATTDRNGAWSMQLPPPPSPDAKPFLVVADYAGNAKKWPSSVTITEPKTTFPIHERHD